MSKLKKKLKEQKNKLTKRLKAKDKKEYSSKSKKGELLKNQIRPQKINQTKILKTSEKEKINKIQPKFSAEDQKERDERTIFIGNLPSNTKKLQLEKLLSQCGKMINCRFRGPNGKKILNKTKSFSHIIGYAVMQSIDDANKSLILNGTLFKDNHIRVTKLENTYSLDDAGKKTIFIGNLKYSATDEKIHNIFSTCGNIEYVRTINNEKGCTGCAYVCFEKKESVGLALELDKILLDDRPIHVEKYIANKKTKVPKKKSETTSGFERRMMQKMSKQLGHKLDLPRQFIKKNEKQIKSNKRLKDEKEKHKKANYRGKKADIKKPNKKRKKSNLLKNLAEKIAPKN